MNINSLMDNYSTQDSPKIKIAIIGSPGSGKSTVAAGLLYFSKLFRFRCDSVPEVAKWDVYSNVDMSDKSYEFKKFKRQRKIENIYPKELEVLICEAPLIISAVFSRFYRGKDDEVSKQMFKLAQQHKNRYTHYVLTRKLFEHFESFGRNEDFKKSEGLHKTTIEILEELKINYITINQYDDHVPLQILEMIGAIIRKKS